MENSTQFRNIAKYTMEDPDVQYLDPYDTVNYDFEFLKYDVDKNTEVTQGVQSAGLVQSPQKIGELMKNPGQFVSVTLSLVAMVLIIVLIIYLVVYLVLYMKGGSENEVRMAIMKMMLVYFIVILLVIACLYWFYNKIVAKSVETGFKLKMG